MHCRAVLLLNQELVHLAAQPLWGVSVHKVPNHPLLCFANLSGLKHSVWESGIFHVTLKFTEHYNEEVPDVVFNTIPFHPNVHPISGKLQADFLNSPRLKRNGNITLANLFLNIQYLLSNPILENTVNNEATQLLQNVPHEYERIVKECVLESQHLHDVINGTLPEELLASYSATPNRELEIISQNPKSIATETVAVPLKAKQVSFDIYHKAWMQFATTKPVSRYVESPTNDDQLAIQMWNPDYANIRSHSSASTIRVAQNRIRSPRAANANPKTNPLRQKKLERISAMKRLYMNRSGEDPGTTAPATSMTDVIRPLTNARNATAVSEAWEREADELVAWTGTLNENAM
ncbi:ubiquitin-conjugating enzyme E2 U-like isoform X1 [Clavelina lepadiformis]|uniref:ubiquitin-conjugating enzyme E2 U-like isoform X1 n=1 Tax=Clavelina lepadiformis TaxID=159417 RepID=UPI004041B0C6